VGKSTVTANLAVALAAAGLSVGLIDADVHGFSIPGQLGLVAPDGSVPQPTRIDDVMLPPVAHGVKVISIGMFLRRGRGDEPLGAVAWRGPMLHRTVQQFLTDVYFGDLDVLLLDMPPGTGDVAISVGQLLPHADVLVVTTPQTAASDVAVRSGLVARQTGQRVIGVIENMSAMTLPDGTVVDVFGSGGGAAVAEALSVADGAVPVLASVPLSPVLRQDADAGIPAVLAHPDDPASRAIARVAEGLAAAPRGLSGRSLPFRTA
jgi:ATP-binding protein involved in chromosome partitioning